MSETTLDFKRILVPVDFSDGSSKALDHATALAAPRHAELVLVHVVEPIIFPTDMFPEQSMAGVDLGIWRENAEILLRKLVHEREAKGLRVKTVVRTGRPFQEIVQVAKDESVDLIVIGSAGHAAATYALLGSTVERVARKAPCAVLITRPKDRTTS